MQSPETSKPWTQGDKRRFYTDRWDIDSPTQLNSLTLMEHSDTRRKQSEFVSQVYIKLSCPDKNVYKAHN